MATSATSLDDSVPEERGSAVPLDGHKCGRVEIRPLREDDREQFLDAARRSASLTAPWSYVMCDDRDFWNMVEQVDLGMETTFVSVDRDDGGIAGKFTVYNTLRGSSQSAMVGYSAFLPYAGTGRTAEALLRIVDTCFADAPHGLELHRLEINCEPENARSIVLARRLGFRHEGRSPRFQLLNGRWRDCDRFALTAEEWAPLRCCR